MKDKIPTHTVTIDNLEVVIYDWLTQDEQQQLLEMSTGDKEFTPGEEIKSVITAAKIGMFNRFKVDSLCKSLSWEEFNSLKPSTRTLILDELQKGVDDESKKK